MLFCAASASIYFIDCYLQKNTNQFFFSTYIKKSVNLMSGCKQNLRKEAILRLAGTVLEKYAAEPETLPKTILIVNLIGGKDDNVAGKSALRIFQLLQSCKIY